MYTFEYWRMSEAAQGNILKTPFYVPIPRDVIQDFKFRQMFQIFEGMSGTIRLISYPVKWPSDRLLQQDWLKFAKLRLFEPKAVWLKKGGA